MLTPSDASLWDRATLEIRLWHLWIECQPLTWSTEFLVLGKAYILVILIHTLCPIAMSVSFSIAVAVISAGKSIGTKWLFPFPVWEFSLKLLSSGRYLLNEANHHYEHCAIPPESALQVHHHAWYGKGWPDWGQVLGACSTLLLSTVCIHHWATLFSVYCLSLWQSSAVGSLSGQCSFVRLVLLILYGALPKRMLRFSENTSLNLSTSEEPSMMLLQWLPFSSTDNSKSFSVQPSACHFRSVLLQCVCWWLPPVHKNLIGWALQKHLNWTADLIRKSHDWAFKCNDVTNASVCILSNSLGLSPKLIELVNNIMTRYTAMYRHKTVI